MPELMQRVLHQQKGAVGVVPVTVNREDAQKIFQWQISNEWRPMTPLHLFDAINFEKAKCKLVPFWYFPCKSDVLYEVSVLNFEFIQPVLTRSLVHS